MKALLIIDMQVACFAVEPPRYDAAGVVRRINALAAEMRNHGLVVFIRHTEPSGAFEQGSAGWELLPALEVKAGDVFVQKPACDSFLETDLDEVLKRRGVTELVVTGCATDFCVDTTVRAAGSHGYEVTVAGDAHTTRDRPHLGATGVIQHHNYVWADLILPRGRTIRVVPTEQLLAELRAPSVQG
jgi:nicotinamidase-related amidase